MKLIPKLAFILTAILVLSCLLMGCTPDEEEQPQSQTLPALESRTETGPEGENGSDPQTQPADTGPAQTDPGSEPAPAGTQAPESGPDEDGLEIESDYTFEVGDNLGVGGN